MLATCQTAMAEVEASRDYRKLTDEQLAEYRRKVSDLGGLIGVQETQLAKAAEAGAEDARALAAARDALEKAKKLWQDSEAELKRVRKSRDRYRKGVVVAAVVSAVAGFILGSR